MGSFRPFGSLRGYRKEWLSGDAIAGLTVWAVLVPEALAYATIAGAPPVVGLYAAPGALILYAVFGSSRHLITGPMSATAALSAAIVAQLATPGSSAFVTLTAALAITAGVIAILAGLLRLGFVANFISEPVLKGFIIGLALTIIVGQLPKLFGVEKGSGDFFEQLWDLVTKLGDTQWRTLVVGLVSFAIVMGFRRFLPIVPGSLVAVAFGVVAVYAFNLDQHGVEIVGNIKGGLPSFGLPDIRAKQYLELGGSSVGLVLIGFAEGLGAAKTYAAQNHYEVDANSELLGLGAANLGAGLSSGMVVNGSLSKTAVNGGAGAKTQVSGLVVAALTVITLLFLTGLFENLHRWSDLARHPDDERIAGVTVLRVEAGLFFANADRVRSVVREAADKDGVRAIVLDAETVAFIDVTAADMLTQLSGELAAGGVELIVAHDVGQVRDTLRETGAADAFGGQAYATVDEALEALSRTTPPAAPSG